MTGSSRHNATPYSAADPLVVARLRVVLLHQKTEHAFGIRPWTYLLSLDLYLTLINSPIEAQHEKSSRQASKSVSTNIISSQNVERHQNATSHVSHEATYS